MPVPPKATRPVRATAVVSLPPGSAEEEATSGQAPYLETLAGVHEALQPALYLEIGVRHGRSLAQT